MNIKTSLLQDYVNFVDNTKKQNKYLKINIFLLLLSYLCFYFFPYLKII